MAEEGDASKDRGRDWERLQRAFLAQCFGGSEPASFGPFRDLAESLAKLMPPGAASGAAGAAPWQSFKAFADLLGEQAGLLRASRKRKVDVSAAMKALLESLMRQLDVLLAAQAIVAGDEAAGLASFDFAERPALGLTRGWQLRLQRLWHAAAAEREAAARLRTLQWRALRAGCEHCGRALDAPGPAITSLRGLYDLFVDGVEAAWRETAMSEDYARAFGASANATLALHGALRELMQPLAGLLELAGRAELDAIDRRLRALEAQVRSPQTHPEAPRAARPAARPARRANATPRAARKSAPRRAEFDIARVIERDESE